MKNLNYLLELPLSVYVDFLLSFDFLGVSGSKKVNILDIST